VKTKRRPPHTQGKFSEIVRLFLRPLLEHKLPTMSVEQYLAEILHVKSRPITPYVVTKGFSFVGTDVSVTNDPRPNVDTGLIRRGSSVWVREDKKLQRVDLEITSGQGRKIRIFQLQPEDYAKKARPYLKEVKLPEREQKFLMPWGQWVRASRVRKS
jgi:hypothetical protein